jgi:hypothetical protein
MSGTLYGFDRGRYPAVDPSKEPVPTLAATGGENAQAQRQVQEDNALQRPLDRLGRDLQREARP